MIASRNNLYIPVFLIVLLGMEASIRYPKYWYGLALVWVLVLLLARLQQADFRVKGLYRAVSAILIPGTGLLFFIHIQAWQHIFSVLMAVLAGYQFYWLRQQLVGPKMKNSGLLFSLSCIFVSFALAHGFHIFLRLPVYLTLLIALLFVTVYPSYLVVLLRKKGPAVQALQASSLKFSISSWFSGSTKNRYLAQNIEMDKFRFWPQRRLSLPRFKILVLLLSVELYLTIVWLPINIIVGSALATICVYGLVSLFYYSEAGGLKPAIVLRYIGLSVFLAILVLSTAQWS